MPLHGFDAQTKALTEYEKNLIPFFVRGLKDRRGKQNAVSNARMIGWFATKGVKISSSRVRKIINYIRLHNTIPGLLANSDGYYVSTDPGEVMMYIGSLDGRIKAITKVKESMKDYVRSISNKKQAEFF